MTHERAAALCDEQAARLTAAAARELDDAQKHEQMICAHAASECAQLLRATPEPPTTRWIVAEWVGHWAVSDGYHGGCKPGPYETEDEAEAAIRAYAAKQEQGCLEPCGKSTPGWQPTPREVEYAAHERDVVLSRHRAVRCDFPEALPEPRLLHTMADVCDYLDADRVTNEALSARVYKDTAAGAWATVEARPRTEVRVQDWYVLYKKVDGKWGPERAVRGGVTTLPMQLAPEAAPAEVQKHFLFAPEDQAALQQWLDEEYPTADMVREEEQLAITYDVDPSNPYARLIFRCGATVEGTERATETVEVELPASEEAIDNAILVVEEEALGIWNTTHGCEACAVKNGAPWVSGETPVDPECADCGGEGIII